MHCRSISSPSASPRSGFGRCRPCRGATGCCGRWPALALALLGWRVGNHGGGWGATLAAIATLAFAQAARTEAAGAELPGRIWLFSRRNAILGAIPFVIGGWWVALLVALLLYACASLFAAQHLRHRLLLD